MKRDRIVSLRLSEVEYARLAERAERMGCSVSDLVRRSVLDTGFQPTYESGSITCSGRASVIWNAPGPLVSVSP